MGCHSRRAAVTHKTRQTPYSFVLHQTPEGVVTWSQQWSEKGTATNRQVCFQTVASGTIANHTLAKQTKGGKWDSGAGRTKSGGNRHWTNQGWRELSELPGHCTLLHTLRKSRNFYQFLRENSASFINHMTHNKQMTNICYYFRDSKIIRIELLKNAETMNWWNNKDFYRLSCSTW